MNSDDLAKGLAHMYGRQLTKSPSPISGSERNFKAGDENFFKNIYPGLDSDEQREDELLSQSYEIQFAQEGSFFRFRTNTESKLDKMSDLRRKQAQVRSVKVDDSVVKFNAEMDDNEKLFIRKDLSLSAPDVKSKFTEQLANLPPLPVNKFRQYSCHDGTSYPPSEVRTIQIFIMPFPKDQRDYPVKCCVQAAAKIEEFIGFILFKITQDFSEVAREVNFEDVTEYGLFITDETGEPDLDFPALDINEQVQRFQFAHLALSKHLAPQAAPNRTLSVVSDTTTVLPIHRQSSIEANKPVSSQNRRTDEILIDTHDTMVEAPSYRAYRCRLVSRKHLRTEIQLGISGEKVEIDPLQQKNGPYFFKPVKAIHYSIDSVAWCEISSRKSSRFVFKIAHNPLYFDPLSFGPSSSFVEPSTPSPTRLKTHTFETDPTSAEEIVVKMNNLLMLRASAVRHEFLTRHVKTKKSFIRKKKFPI